MSNNNRIGYYTRQPILGFINLKKYAGHLVKDGASLIYQAHLSAKDKVRVPPLLAEIERLKAQLAAQREEGSEAGKKALALYWENCTLQTYKKHAEGIYEDWIPRAEHETLKRNHQDLHRLHDALSRSNRFMEQEWAEFMNKYNVRV